METKHTPTPWKWRTPRTGCRQAYLVGSGEIPIAYLAQPELQDPRKRKANATFIVRACNSHDALLKELRNTNNCLIVLCGADLLRSDMKEAIEDQIKKNYAVLSETEKGE